MLEELSGLPSWGEGLFEAGYGLNMAANLLDLMCVRQHGETKGREKAVQWKDALF